MEQKRLGIISLPRVPTTPYPQRNLLLPSGQLIGTHTRNVTLWSVSSRSSNGFAESSPDMTNAILRSLLLFTLVLLLFC